MGRGQGGGGRGGGGGGGTDRAATLQATITRARAFQNQPGVTMDTFRVLDIRIRQAEQELAQLRR